MLPPPPHASPSRGEGLAAGNNGRIDEVTMGGPQGEEGEEGEDGGIVWSLPAVAAASQSRMTGGVGTGGGQGKKEGPDGVAKRTRGRAIEVLEMDAASSGPPIVLKTANHRDAHTHAAKTSVSSTYLSDSAGSMWEMPGVPTPAVNASYFNLSEMVPYPVFESKIGTHPSQKRSPEHGAKAKPPHPGAGLDAMSADAESEIKNMSQSQIRALMEAYFPSLEDRLRRCWPASLYIASFMSRFILLRTRVGCTRRCPRHHQFCVLAIFDSLSRRWVIACAQG